MSLFIFATLKISETSNWTDKNAFGYKVFFGSNKQDPIFFKALGCGLIES